MDAWESVVVPKLPAAADSMVRLHNPLTGDTLPVGPASGEARLYACGITPYDATHLGHAFTYVSVDLLVRAWMDTALTVRYAQNVTDVDDPLLERANATGVDWEALAAEQIELFRTDMRTLRVLPPAQLTGVVESLELVTGAIQRLKDRQVIYQVPDPAYPDWYFSITSTSNLLADSPVSMLEADQLFAERGGDPEREGKRHRLDPLLWRQQRAGEPGWDSWLGRGRPGWHIECTAIAVDALGPAFDVQAGGRDLAFPHHPMSAAGARALTGEPFAKAFLHTGMVGYAGAKMSKSLGNLVFVSQLLADGVDPMAIRLLLLSQHYRSDWEYTPELLAAAADRLARWRAAVGAPTAPNADSLVAAVRAAIRNDLDAPSALAALDAWAQSVSEGGGADAAAPGLVRDLVDALLGVRL
ncbi:cysteine--1-D-myo-inosityl 2-amino-2-deoxy-alpha-D-glucopyranoside ligase [Propionicimonas sp.]|uniref:cysteine--1-D-myo-inosityl 2-amino-2-deoxy-alpha-D-glucopyranoside ligase n=1 Tax=Propionicimonas sp. TaxID=1955623 RepID=UPI001794AEB8|nr:cysteine--1-D-myo-inosityl 2-amino-2-deoxy-alpha-D-glucopyranoside ligase [Propionicimonas sp.]MBU3976243.1 cysteine--1-D-myo-inosityl 2-amino-2-deoxy-alpha-D-glucopyranoside ligase [Actinomycetota bacterium]MBA3021055.1 cysteine--1-D-myo-inosityl 2-amino-2-deoxy-alpha-D-glucopyranoside ligase [Propionicimonas sp.]MBU3985638.1 cysteine--1-D-myo-inosityl 2-amino-2-deoxy-alpha-D-glucopyranoside ligase [Actinomycetota bacterium]MBU4008423.1 cysteine--1-D-myo-inosityl 2-amino-2-deoxy-alpha-D-glu